MILKVLSKLWANLWANDFFFFFLPLIFSIASGVSIVRNISKLKTKIKKMPDNPDWADDLRKSLNTAYSVFTTSITLYPLLGMLGTVFSLINVGDVDFSQASESLNAIKGDFFTALTSTAWGIVFAAILKFINSLIQPRIEDYMNILTSLVDDYKEKNGTKYTV